MRFGRWSYGYGIEWKEVWQRPDWIFLDEKDPDSILWRQACEAAFTYWMRKAMVKADASPENAPIPECEDWHYPEYKWAKNWAKVM